MSKTDLKEPHNIFLSNQLHHNYNVNDKAVICFNKGSDWF